MTLSVHGKRGRPSKFGKPGRVAAFTLPDEVVRGLRKINPDLAWAIVTLFEKSSKRAPTNGNRVNFDLLEIADRRSLIVVDRAIFRKLPGINIIPLDSSHAFLALEVGQGLADLELAVHDRLASSEVAPRERKGLAALRDQLSAWRRDRGLRFHSRSIIVAERIPAGARRRYN